MTKSSTSRRKEIIKIKAELHDIETKRTIQRINKSRSWFFEKINKIDEPLIRLIKKKERTQINKIINERGEVKTDMTKIQRIIRYYYEQLYAKTGQPGRNRQISTFSLPKLNQEEADSQNTLKELVKSKQ